MKLRNPVKEIKIDQHRLKLYLEEGVSIVEVDNQLFRFLLPLVEHVKQLSDDVYLEEFATISNFFWKGQKFQTIDSISDYQKFYRDRVDFERKNPADLLEYRLTDFRLFDVSVMHPPTVERGFLYYYTYQVSNWVPYRVVCPFPYHLEDAHVHYQILPFA